MAVTNPDAPPHVRASQIIVPTDTPGFERVRNIPIMGDAGDGWASHAEIRYHGCRVPQSNRLGAEGAGFLIAQERLGPGRIHHCMRWIGICERVFEMMCRRAATRQIAPDKTLATRQIVQAWIAESRAAIDAARLMVLHAAWTIDKQGFEAAREEVSLIKFYVADVMMRVVDRAIQVHGALGMTSDTVLAYYYVARARRAHLRRARRGPQDGGRQAHPEALRRGGAARVSGARRDPAAACGRGARRRALAAYLAAHMPDLGGREPSVEVEQFPGGHSNLTYLLRHGAREFVLRRPPFGSKVKSAHDMGREFRVLSRLTRRVQGPAPDPRVPGRVGARRRFYLMERLRGVILRRELPAGVEADAPPRGGCAWRSSTPSSSCTRSTTRPSASAISASPRATSSARCAAGPSATPARRPTTSRR